MSNPPETIASLRDEITQLRQRVVELEAQASEGQRNRALLQAFLDHSALVIFVKDRQRRMLMVNQAFAAFLGLTVEDMLGKTDHDLFPKAAADEFFANEERVFATGQPIEFEDVAEKDGKVHTFLTVKFPIFNEQGDIIALGGVSTDITDRKQAEEHARRLNVELEQRVAERTAELYASEAKNRALLDAIPDMMFIQQRDSTFIDYRAPRDATYAPPEAFLGKKINEIFPLHLVEPFRVGIEQAFLVGPQMMEYTLPDGRGPGGTFEARIIAVDTETVLTLVRNITERKRAEEERATMQQQIIDAQRMALRELSTPLIPISDDVVIMPLIGTIDTRRAQQVMEVLLEGVANYQADTVILDITGVKVVDTQVANAFLRVARAVQLLGARVIITGIQPEIAQAIVHLEAELTGIATYASLQAAIAVVLGRVRR